MNRRMLFLNKWIQAIYSKYKVYLKSASLYFFASIFTAGLKMLINPVLAKNLTHEDYAITGYYGSFSLLFLPLLSFLFVTFYQRNYYLISEERRQKLANTILLSLLGIGSSVSFIVLLGFYAYCKYTNVSFPFLPFAIFTVYQIVFNNFLVFLQAQYRLQREAKKFAKLAIVSSLIWLIIVLLLVVVLKLGAKGSMGANLFVAILVGIYSFRKAITKIEFDKKIFHEALKFCWPIALSALLWYFLSGVDRLMLEKLNDSYTFGLYNVGATLSGFFGVFYIAIAQTFEPDIYKAIADKKFSRLIKIITGIVLFNAIPVILFIFFAPLLTNLLTAGRYTDAAPFARILSLKVITTSLYYSVITIIVGFGFTKSELGLRAVGAVLCILMFTILIKNFGFYGAAWGQVLAFLLMSVLGFAFILVKLKTNKLYVKSN